MGSSGAGRNGPHPIPILWSGTPPKIAQVFCYRQLQRPSSLKASITLCFWSWLGRRRWKRARAKHRTSTRSLMRSPPTFAGTRFIARRLRTRRERSMLTFSLLGSSPSSGTQYPGNTELARDTGDHATPGPQGKKGLRTSVSEGLATDLGGEAFPPRDGQSALDGIKSDFEQGLSGGLARGRHCLAEG